MSDYLPQELTFQILLRLPIPDVVRCTAVCKQWNALISNHEFIASRLAFTVATPNPKPPLLLRYCTQSPSAEFYSLHFHPNSFSTFLPISFPFSHPERGYYHILGSIHGLVCLSYFSTFCLSHTYGDEIFLWNPTIRRYIKLPLSRSSFGDVGGRKWVLCFFGFDSVRNDYKVLRMVYTRTLGHSEVPPKVEVYSLRERLWREISADGLETCVYRYDLSQCYLNGAVHWVAYENGRTCIMLFDMFHERFCKMELPNDLINEWALSISEIKGCVGVIHYKCVAVEGKAAKCPEIWVMKEYGVHHSWAKIYSFHGKVDIELVLGMSGNCNILFAKNGVGRKNEVGLASLNPLTGATMDTGIRGVLDEFYAGAQTESLVLFDNESGAISY